MHESTVYAAPAPLEQIQLARSKRSISTLTFIVGKRKEHEDKTATLAAQHLAEVEEAKEVAEKTAHQLRQCIREANRQNELLMAEATKSRHQVRDL